MLITIWTEWYCLEGNLKFSLQRETEKVRQYEALFVKSKKGVCIYVLSDVKDRIWHCRVLQNVNQSAFPLMFALFG